MKKVISLCLLLSSLMIYSQNRKTDLQNEGLKGKVKSVRETPYRAIEEEGKIEKGEIMKSKSSRVAREIEDMYANIHVEYTLQGGRMTMESYKENNSLENKFTYHYDEKRNKTEVKIYEENNSLDAKLVYYYDDKGNKTEIEVYRENGRLEGKVIYTYDDKGDMIGMDFYEDNLIIYRFTYRNDDKGNVIEGEFYVGDIESKYTCHYDDKGSMIEQNWYNSDGSLDSSHTYQYQYDDQNNWIEKITYVNDKPIEITTRDIEYYK